MIARVGTPTQFRLELARRDGALERVVATLSRKRVVYTMLHAEIRDDRWTVELVVSQTIWPDLGQLIAVLEREPHVIAVVSETSVS